MHRRTFYTISWSYSSLDRRPGRCSEPSCGIFSALCGFGAVSSDKCRDNRNLPVAERHKDADGNHDRSGNFQHAGRIFLVLGIAPFPKLGVLGAGAATLLAQSIRCIVLLAALCRKQKGMKWRWPWQSPEIPVIFAQLFQTTYPLALSEMLWGISAFLYTVVFTRLGTSALAASQIVMVIENVFIVAASGLAPSAVALIGQAIGAGSIRCAKMHARKVLQLGVLAGLLFTVLLVGASFLLPTLYPQVGNDVLELAFWGLLIAALVQPAKVLNSVFGNGILPCCKDTKFVLATHLIGSYLVGLPAAVLLGIFWGLSARGVFSSRAIEEIIKAIVFFFFEISKFRVV